MSRTFPFPSYEAFLPEYKNLPVEELVKIFNRSHANNNGWTSARANASAALRECFLLSGLNTSDFIGGNYMSCNAPIEIKGNRIQRQQ